MADDFTIPNQRKGDWIELLRSHCDAWQGHEFQYGTHDCFQFCAAAIREMTDLDVMEGVKYNTLEQALSYLTKGKRVDGKKVGGMKTAEGFWTHWLGEPKPIGFAQRGDIVLYTARETPYLAETMSGQTTQYDVRPNLPFPGVVGASGGQVWVMTQESGLCVFNRADGAMAWSV